MTGVTSKESLEIHPNEMYREVSEDLAEVLKEKLETCKLTMVKVTDDKQLVLEDLKITVVGDLLISQEQAFSKARMELSKRLDFTMIFDFFELLSLNNYFLHKGYNIIADQEDTFFEIISGDNKELKRKLETYLSVYDRLSKHKSLYEKFCDFEDEINRARTKEEVDSQLDIFLTLFR